MSSRSVAILHQLLDLPATLALELHQSVDLRGDLRRCGAEGFGQVALLGFDLLGKEDFLLDTHLFLQDLFIQLSALSQLALVDGDVVLEVSDLLHQQCFLAFLLGEVGFQLLNFLEQAQIFFDFDFVEVVELVVLFKDFAIESALVARVLFADHQL